MAEQFQNFFVTKLREACDATATTIYVDTVPAITEGTLVLEYANSTKHEIIHFTGVSGYGLTGCTRGLEGTTAQSHSAGTDVRQNLTAGMIDKIINGVITTENIANSAVTTAKINNGAVTADKIDFTTLADRFPFNTSYQEVHSGSLQLTVPETGVYFIFGSTNRNTDTLVSMDLCYDGNTIQAVALAPTGSNGWRNWTMATIWPLTAGKKVDIRNGANVQSAQASGRASLCIFRVA